MSQKASNQSKRHTQPTSTSGQHPISSGNLTESLASARGKPSYSTSPQSLISSGTSPASQKYKIGAHLSPHSSPTSDYKRNQPSPLLENPDEEPFYKFYSNITTIVYKTHAQTRDKAKFTNKYHQANPKPRKLSPSSSKLADTFGGGLRNPTDSYYVVPTEESRVEPPTLPSSASQPPPPSDLAAENASLKESLQQATRSLDAYSDTFDRQKEAIKSSLAQLRAELHSREHQRTTALNAQIEELQAENDKLKIQMGRMKSRWEGLKESARKRR